MPEKWIKTADEELKVQRELYDKYNNIADGRIRIWFGLRTIFNNSDELIVKTKKIADELNTGIHMHIVEIAEENDYVKLNRGNSTVEHLHKLGDFSILTVLGILGLAIMAICEIKKIKGGILISIAITTIIGIFLGIVEVPKAIISMPPSVNPIFMKVIY